MDEKYPCRDTSYKGNVDWRLSVKRAEKHGRYLRNTGMTTQLRLLVLGIDRKEVLEGGT
jgi:flagellar motor protein MotB